MQHELNFEIAELGAQTGMMRSTNRADRVTDDWSDNAELLFKYYAMMHRDGFMTEDVRVWAKKLGFAEPPDNRAWGSVARKLAKAKAICAVGYGKQRSVTCHGSPKTIWKMN